MSIDLGLAGGKKHLVDKYTACGKNEVLSLLLVERHKAIKKGEKHGNISLVE